MIRLVIILSIILALSGCASGAPKELVNIAMTPSVDISHYHTWSFDIAASIDSGHEAVDDEFIKTHLLSSVKAVLGERGFVFREKGAVDFKVSYRIILDQFGEQGPDTARARGTLLIRDTKTNRIVWSGEVKRIVTDGARPTEERIRSIDDTVRGLLKYFAT